MTIRFLVAASAAALLSLSSCKKDDPAPVTSNPPAAKKLKKISRTENGITTVFNLTYDNNNRLLSFKNATNTEFVNFSYNTEGKLTGIEEQERGFRNVYNYTYQNGIPVSGTLKSWELVSGQPDELIEDDRLTYTVTNNKVTRIRLEMLQSASEMDLDLTYSGANLTRVESLGSQFPYTAIFTYGTKKPAFPKVSEYVLDQSGFSLQFASNNEILTGSFDFPGTTFDQTINTQYTYDSNGYVLTSNDGDTQILYEYQ